MSTALQGDDDLEGSGGGLDEEEGQTLFEILKGLPVLFLLNKNDKSEFKGVDQISQRLGLAEINCIDSVCLPVSALDMNGVDAALSWIYKTIPECSNL